MELHSTWQNWKRAFYATAHRVSFPVRHVTLGWLPGPSRMCRVPQRVVFATIPCCTDICYLHTVLVRCFCNLLLFGTMCFYYLVPLRFKCPPTHPNIILWRLVADTVDGVADSISEWVCFPIDKIIIHPQPWTSDSLPFYKSSLASRNVLILAVALHTHT